MSKVSDINRPLTVREFARAVGLNYKTVWRACVDGELEHTRFGRKILIPRRVAERYLNGSK